MSKQSFITTGLRRGSPQRSIEAKNSSRSINAKDPTRVASIANAALTVKGERRQRVKAVKNGYRENDVFEHTAVDIHRVLKQRLAVNKNHTNDLI